MAEIIKEIRHQEDEVVVFFIMPIEKAALATKAFCKRFGYQPKIMNVEKPGEMIDNPQNPEKFTKARIVDYIEQQSRVFLEEEAREQLQLNSDLGVKI